MIILWPLLALLASSQAPPTAPPLASPAALAALPLPSDPAPKAVVSIIRAQYDWGYAGRDGQGKGTLSVLVEPASGRVILELQGLGERLLLLEGSNADGFRLQIPRQQVDQRAPALKDLPVPFLPQVGTSAALYHLLGEGVGPGVKVTRKDADGPVKLRFDGKDDRKREVTVWLQRTRWEREGAK